MPPRNKSKQVETEIEIKRETVRFTLDLDPEQHRFLKLYSLENGVKASVILRALVYLLEVDETIANRVIDEIFAE
ncbi:MAG: hypothetical protein H9W81_12785 [Enterococcus sp.]|nr:hypothetical protein [Enterococcus sp.]